MCTDQDSITPYMVYLQNIYHAGFSVLSSKRGFLRCLLPPFLPTLPTKHKVQFSGGNWWKLFLRVIGRIRLQCTCSLFKRCFWRIDDIRGDGLWKAVALSVVKYQELMFRARLEKSVKLFQWQFCVLTRWNFSPFLTSVWFCYWQLKMVVRQRPDKINQQCNFYWVLVDSSSYSSLFRISYRKRI